MKDEKTQRGYSLLLNACIGALIGIVAFSPIWMRNHGQLMEYGDYFLQYVPFIKELKRVLVSTWGGQWSWNSFLGDSFISAYSYYTVFNPFAWFVALFPDNAILYGTMVATILKLSVSMVGATLYISRFCKKETTVLIGALLYTFSGFTYVNTNFYFFLDVTAVFPFLMYGLECLLMEGKRTAYIIALSINAAINYYFFVSTVFLVIIYVVFRLELYKISSWKQKWKIFLRLTISSVIGTGLAGIALIPSFFAILGSGKATGTIGTKLLLTYWPQNILERLRVLVAPIESGRYHAFYDGSTWSSTGIYLPIFGSTLVLQYCIKKKDWLKKVCILLTVCLFVPMFNAVFNLFSSTDYTRWLYGMALVFSLATALLLEEAALSEQVFSKKLLFAVSVFTAGLLAVPTVLYFLHRAGISLLNRFASACTTIYFIGYPALVVMLVLTVLNYAGLWYLFLRRNVAQKTILAMVIAACAVNFLVYNEINYDLHTTNYSNEYYYQKSLIQGDENRNSEVSFRIDHPGQIANYSLFKNKPSVNYYNSLQNAGGSRFAQAVGIGENLEDTILLTPAVGGEYTNALLSVKYYYDYDGNVEIPQGFRYVETVNYVDIYENENYISMGFLYDSYCLEEELAELSPERRAEMMLQSLVIRKDDAELVGQYLQHNSDIKTGGNLTELAKERRETVCDSFTGTTKGFEASIHLETDNIVFFSIPDDPGWKITVNGEPAKIIEVNYGLLGILCGAGNNDISAVYQTRGLSSGMGISVVCLMSWMSLEIAIRKRKKQTA